MASSVFRRMPALEIINLSARVYRNHVVGLVVITLLPQGLLLGVESLVGGLNLVPEEPLARLVPFMAAAVVLNAFALSAITAAMAGAVLGFMPTVPQAFGVAFRNNLLGVVLTYLIVAGFILAGLVVFVLPGLILGGLLAPAIPIIVIERLGPFQAVARSFAMMREELAKGVAVFLYFFLVSNVIPFFVVLALGFSPLLPIFGVLIGSVTLPLAHAANVILYFSIRTREGYSREQLETELNRLVQG